ncbi:response regulator [Sulfurimonas sp.]|uniref:response regulator n=1 Tax=Sulfurimonas sp. TaxID=2022749 RepID=UPI003563AFD2
MLKEQIEIDENVVENMKSLTLLCVEDDNSTQLLYETIFKEFINKIVFAKDGEDGYEKYLSNEVDIIISDYSMPKLNGLDMIKQIRELNKDIPIILVTGITEIDIILEALQLNVNNFIRKPIKSHEVVNALISVSKILIANKYLEDQKNAKLKELEDKEQYSSYQEDLAFAKELNILRNDFYYQLIDMKCTALVDFSYQPLDILSGDAYSARKLDQQKTFYLIVDGMGKGLSASLTSMLITSYINHVIDKMQESDGFDLHKLVSQALEYIKPILLDEEALSIDFIVLDCDNAQMEYAKFSMPALMMQTKENELIKLKSNNPPISKYIRDFTISTYNTCEIIKFLFYSDGMVENPTRFKDKLYIEYIEEDFLDSFTKENMKEKLLWKINIPEDDITFIFINKLDLDNTVIAKKSFNTNLNEVEESNEWYADIWDTLTDDTKLIYSAGIVFTELFMNAYEHGNLSLDSQTKHRLIEEDTYLNTLLQKQETCDKQINVTINRIQYGSSIYIITQISDEGEGFDTQILSEIFRNSKSFNGRGVFVSRSSSLGIYYNSKGNSVLFLHKV